jgi:hypothetical protein
MLSNGLIFVIWKYSDDDKRAVDLYFLDKIKNKLFLKYRNIKLNDVMQDNLS